MKVMAVGRVFGALHLLITVVGLFSTIVHSYQLIHKYYELGSVDGEFVSLNGPQPFNVRAKVLRQDLVRGRAKAFHGRKVLYYSNANATTQFELLHLSGNVELNPGPDKVQNQESKTYCAGCSKIIKVNQYGVSCSSCPNIFHGKCTEMSRLNLRRYKLNPQESGWCCSICALPRFSDSFFDETSSTDNSILPSVAGVDDSVNWFTSNVNSYYKSNLKIAYLNINSIQNKLDEVKHMLNGNLFDILFIAETKIDSTFPNNLLSQPGYRQIRRDRQKGAGGLIAFIRDDLLVYRRRKLEPQAVESICLDVRDSRKSRFIVCACYRSPKFCKVPDFISSLASATELMYRTRNELLLLGDFNLDMTADGNSGKSPDRNLSDFCDRFCLSNQITEPTRVTDKTSTLIDVMLSSHPERFATWGNLHLGLSDHDLIYAVRRNKLPRPRPREIEYRSMKSFNESDFLADLGDVPWDTAYVFENADDIWDHWVKLYTAVLDKHAPVKKKRIRGDQLPWITPQLQKEISYRNRLFKLHKRNPSQLSWETFRKQRNKVTALKRRGMKDFCVDACTNLKHHGEFWKKMKPLLPSKGKSKSKTILFENDRVINNSLEVAEVFNKYFCDTAVSDGDR